LLGAGDALRQATGFTQSIWGRFESDQTMTALRRHAQRSYLNDAYREGRSMAMEEAVAFASTILEDVQGTRVMSGATREHQMPRSSLSKREQEVLRLVAEGLANKAIAQRLCISPSTVSYHLTSIFHKLGVDTRVQALVATMGHDRGRAPW
jgi:DNA-binding NarL/FixJ family response regulator